MKGTPTSLLAASLLAAYAADSPGQPDCSGWEFVPSPDPTSGTNILYDVDGSAPDNVWAVGSGTADDTDSTPKTLAMHWDGTTWTIVPTPNPRQGWNDFAGVATLAADDAWAVGAAGSGEPRVMIQHWDGVSWSAFDTVLNLAVGSAEGIEAIAADDIWAVGRLETPSLAAHYDGSDWELFPVPQVGALRNPLLDVSAVASDDVWAVGYWSDSFGQFEPLAAHWDGSAWTAMVVPSFGPLSHLRGVAALAADDVWAVGDYYDLQEATQPLIVHWDGSSWTPIDLPIFPGGPAELRAIAARAPDDIYAAGAHQPPGEDMTALIMHYDGVGWAVVEPPDVVESHEWFRGMGAVPSGEVWAVGQYFNGRYTSTLTERFVPGACCGVDYNGDGAVDTQDVLAFLNAWGAGDAEADFNGDGEINTLDVLAFLDAWNAGC